MKVIVESLLINSDGTPSSSSLDIPESINVAKLKVEIASSLLGTPFLHPNFLVLRLQDRELSDHTKSLEQYSIQDSDRITCLVKESGYYDIEHSFALCCSLHEVFEEVRKYYEENVRLVSEIEAVETVSQFKYLGDYHVHEGRPRFRIQIRRVKVAAKDIVSEYRVAGEEEGEERLLPISDHFNDAIRYDDCQTFPRLVALNNEMMLAMQKYVDLFENENKKILKILQTFAHNYLIIYRNLRRLRGLVEDDVDRMPELEEHEQIINQQFKQLALMNVEFSVDFYASKVLNSSQAKALRSLLPRGADTNYQLLYRASRDGKDSSSFHRQCDNRGPTVTIIRDNHGNIFGGYTSVSWDQSGDYYHDPSAFLFTLQNTHGIPPTKYVKNATTHAIYCASNYGPTFGGGHDIYIDNGHTNSCYSRFPHSFTDTTGKGRSTFTPQSNFTPVEIEVWKCPSEDFRNSVILDDALTYALREILPSTCSPTLLYRSSRDGRDATSFHHLCDNQGSTVTLIRDEEGNIFGGFASSSWHSENSYSDDLSSFLFTLKNARGGPAMKFLRNTSVAHGIFGGVGYGPTFGGGHDIYIDNVYSDQCYCNFPYSYIDSTGLGSAVFTSKRNFIPQEIEAAPWIYQAPNAWDKEWKSGVWTYLDKVPIERSRMAVMGGVYIPVYAPTKNASVLDVGCGEGTLSDYLLPGVRENYVGVDISKEAISRARTLRAPLKFEVSLAHEFVPSQKFDVVIFSEMLYYVEHENVLKQYEGYLKPNGVIIISIYLGSDNRLDKSHQAIVDFARIKYKVLDEVQLVGILTRSNGKKEQVKSHVLVLQPNTM